VVMQSGDVIPTISEQGYWSTRVQGTNGEASNSRMLSFQATIEAEL